MTKKPAPKGRQPIAQEVLDAQLREAQDGLYSVYTDDNVRFLDPPDWTWKPVPAPRIHAHAISAYPAQQKVLDTEVNRLNTYKPRHAVMYNQSVVHVNDAVLRDEVTASDRTLMMFRKKGRLRQDYRRILTDYLDTAPNGADHALPVFAGAPMSLADLDPDVVFRLPTPGIHNFFHGVWEILPQLMPLSQAGFKGRIALRSLLREMPGFIRGFAEVVFPELIDQIEMDQIRPMHEGEDAGHYQDFYTAFDWAFYANLAADAPVDIGMPEPGKFEDFDTLNLSRPYAFNFNFANSYTINQKAFRDQAVANVAHMDFSHLPRRFWISRKGSLRRPEVAGEDELVTELREFGFEEVRLETLSFAEQIGIFQNAEFAAGQHGAGMTNMMFASPDTTVLEIGHGQTVQRWRTFHQMAAASGCRYESFFCDYDTDTPTVKPNLRVDGFPVPACPPVAIDMIISRVDALVNGAGVRT